MVAPLHEPPAVSQELQSKWRKLCAAGGLVVLCCIPVLMAVLVHRTGTVRQLQRGELMPPLNLRSVDSTSLQALDLNGKHAALLFFSVDCPRCWTEISNFEQLFHSFNDKYTFVGISSGNSRQTMNFVNERKISFPIFLDEQGEATETFGITEVPTLILGNSEGAIIHRDAGVWSLEARRKLLSASIYELPQRAR